MNYFKVPQKIFNKFGASMGLPVHVFDFWEVCASLSVQVLWLTPA